MSNASLNLAKKVKVALLRQVPKIADQVCDSAIVTSAAAPSSLHTEVIT
jgi:hypothetical protein